MKASEYILTEHFHNQLAKNYLKIEDFTCHDCPEKEDCDSSYGIYNIDGDCLEATVPRENDPAMTKTRKIVETLFHEISVIMAQRRHNTVLREG